MNIAGTMYLATWIILLLIGGGIGWEGLHLTNARVGCPKLAAASIACGLLAIGIMYHRGGRLDVFGAVVVGIGLLVLYQSWQLRSNREGR